MQTRKFIAFYCPTCHILKVASQLKTTTRISKLSRITSKGYGETKLVNACPCEDEAVSTCTEKQHQNNRRTEFIVIKE